MDNSPILLDKNGYKLYLKSIEDAEQELRKIQRYKGEVAIYQGDNWHDNPTLYQTEMDERMALRRLQDLKSELARIQIIEDTHLESKDIVSFNRTITIIITIDGEAEECTLKLVASTAKNSTELSVNSPLGTAILGKRINDFVQYKVNSEIVTAQIVNIN